MYKFPLFSFKIRFLCLIFVCFCFPYFDQDAFTHNALHMDAPGANSALAIIRHTYDIEPCFLCLRPPCLSVLSEEQMHCSHKNV